MFESLLETLKYYSLVGPILVAAPIAIFAILLTIYFQWWRNRKSLSYEVLTSTSLFSVNADVKHRVEVTLDGKPVRDVQLVIIEIQNDGFLPIEDKDFATPIRVDFGENSEIISVENKENYPEDLPVKFTFEKSKIEIESLLLNRKDSIKLQVLINNFSEELNISVRVKGISKVKSNDISTNFFTFLKKEMFNRIFIYLIFWWFLWGSYVNSQDKSNILFILICIFTIYIGFSPYIFFSINRNRTKKSRNMLR